MESSEIQLQTTNSEVDSSSIKRILVCLAYQNLSVP